MIVMFCLIEKMLNNLGMGWDRGWGMAFLLVSLLFLRGGVVSFGSNHISLYFAGLVV